MKSFLVYLLEKIIRVYKWVIYIREIIIVNKYILKYVIFLYKGER